MAVDASKPWRRTPDISNSPYHSSFPGAVRVTAEPSPSGRIVPKSVIAADGNLTLILGEPAKHVLCTELKL
jgi:hypothetical protein